MEGRPGKGRLNRQQCRPGHSSISPPGGARGTGVGACRLVISFSLRLSLKTHRGVGWLFPSIEGSGGSQDPREGAHPKLGYHSSKPGTRLACPSLVGQEGASSLLGDQDTPR